MMKMSLKYFLCMFFLQQSLVYSDQSLGKTIQSRPHSSNSQKQKRKPANSPVTSGRSGGCNKSCETRKKSNKKQRRNLHEGLVKVSYYNLPGNKTANGEVFRSNGMTVANKTLPFHTKLRFFNPENGKAVVVRVNDRGPFEPGREYDLAKGPAKILGITEKGVATLRVSIVSMPASS